MSRLWVDIETLPGDLDDDAVRALAARKVPKNIRKPETRDRWIEDHLDEVYRRTSLDALRGRVLCIAAAEGWESEPVCFYGGDDVLLRFEEWLMTTDAAEHQRRFTWCGWNVRFDLQFLRLHGARAGAKWLVTRLPCRSSEVLDVQSVATAYQRKYLRLADAAAFFGLAKAEGIDGSKVYDAWLKGRHEDLARYCAGDVQLTREIAYLLGA